MKLRKLGTLLIGLSGFGSAPWVITQAEKAVARPDSILKPTLTKETDARKENCSKKNHISVLFSFL